MILNVLIGIVLNSLEEARELERRRRLGIGLPPETEPRLRRSPSGSRCCARR